jgi:hypothetical protein
MEHNDTSAATCLPDVPIYASDIEMLHTGHIKQIIEPVIWHL